MELNVYCIEEKLPRTCNACNIDHIVWQKIQREEDCLWQTCIICAGVSENSESNRIGANSRRRQNF